MKVLKVSPEPVLLNLAIKTLAMPTRVGDFPAGLGKSVDVLEPATYALLPESTAMAGQPGVTILPAPPVGFRMAEQLSSPLPPR